MSGISPPSWRSLNKFSHHRRHPLCHHHRQPGGPVASYLVSGRSNPLPLGRRTLTWWYWKSSLFEGTVLGQTLITPLSQFRPRSEMRRSRWFGASPKRCSAVMPPSSTSSAASSLWRSATDEGDPHHEPGYRRPLLSVSSDEALPEYRLLVHHTVRPLPHRPDDQPPTTVRWGPLPAGPTAAKMASATFRSP